MTELRKRLNALENGQQSQSRKASTKPTPQNNPELKSICDQLQALIRQIAWEMDDANRRGRGAEADQLFQLHIEAVKVAQRIGCGGKYLSPRPGGLVIDKLKAKK